MTSLSSVGCDAAAGRFLSSVPTLYVKIRTFAMQHDVTANLLPLSLTADDVNDVFYTCHNVFNTVLHKDSSI